MIVGATNACTGRYCFHNRCVAIVCRVLDYLRGISLDTNERWPRFRYWPEDTRRSLRPLTKREARVIAGKRLVNAAKTRLNLHIPKDRCASMHALLVARYNAITFFSSPVCTRAQTNQDMRLVK